jgi:hypothetical protein
MAAALATAIMAVPAVPTAMAAAPATAIMATAAPAMAAKAAPAAARRLRRPLPREAA